MTSPVGGGAGPSGLGCEPIATSGWADPAERSCWPTLAEGAAADVVVIGGGYVGLTAALQLALAGREVRLLEAREVGSGASGRNCAHVMPTWGTLRPSEVEQRFADQGKAMNRRIAASGRLLSDLIATHGIDCDARLRGQANLTSSGKTAAGLADLVAEWQAVGGDVELLDAAEAQAFAASPRYVGGYAFRSGGTLQPLKLARGLAAAAERHGVRGHEGTAALAITATGRGWRVETPGGEISARSVIVATNGYTGDLWPGLSGVGYSLPIGMLISAPLDATQQAVMPANLPFSDMDDPTLFSGLLTTDGRYVTSVLPGPLTPTTERMGRVVDKKFARTFPGVRPPRWERSWFGREMMTPSKLPSLIELAPGLYAGLGCNGFGICGGTLLGSELARAIIDEPGDRPVLPIQQLTSAPLRRSFPFLFRNVLTPALRNLH